MVFMKVVATCIIYNDLTIYKGIFIFDAHTAWWFNDNKNKQINKYGVRSISLKNKCLATLR